MICINLLEKEAPRGDPKALMPGDQSEGAWMEARAVFGYGSDGAN